LNCQVYTLWGIENNEYTSGTTFNPLNKANDLEEYYGFESTEVS